MNRIFLFAIVAVFITTAAQAEDLTEDLQAGLNKQVQALTDEVKAEGPHFILAGEIKSGFRNGYSVNGEDFVVDKDTEVFGGTLRPGLEAEVSGNLLPDGKKIARKVVLRTNEDGGGSFQRSRDPLGMDSNTKVPEPSAP